MNLRHLFLKYKYHQCYGHRETEIDTTDGSWVNYGRDWTECEEDDEFVWSLKAPGDYEYLKDSNGNIEYFFRFEFRTKWSTEPIVICFLESVYLIGNPVRKYRLPDNYRTTDAQFWDWNGDRFIENIQPILLEYERHRDGEWRPPVFVYNGDKK